MCVCVCVCVCVATTSCTPAAAVLLVPGLSLSLSLSISLSFSFSPHPCLCLHWSNTDGAERTADIPRHPDDDDRMPAVSTFTRALFPSSPSLSIGYGTPRMRTVRPLRTARAPEGCPAAFSEIGCASILCYAVRNGAVKKCAVKRDGSDITAIISDNFR